MWPFHTSNSVREPCFPLKYFVSLLQNFIPVLTIRLKYYLFCSLLLGVLFLKAQEPNEISQAIVTIIGNDPIQANNTHDFINTNPYDQPNVPPGKQQKVQKNQNIEPTLENGFHMRFEVSFSENAKQTGSASVSSSDKEYGKVKKRGIKLAERSFNAKKRFRKWMPCRKKKYRPTLCGRF